MKLCQRCPAGCTSRERDEGRPGETSDPPNAHWTWSWESMGRAASPHEFDLEPNREKSSLHFQPGRDRRFIVLQVEVVIPKRDHRLSPFQSHGSYLRCRWNVREPVHTPILDARVGKDRSPAPCKPEPPAQGHPTESWKLLGNGRLTPWISGIRTPTRSQEVLRAPTAQGQADCIRHRR